MSMSLDGFVGSDREHPGTAIPEGEELKQWKLDRVGQAGAHLKGSRHVPGDVLVLAAVEGPVRRAHERHPEGGVLDHAPRRRGHLAGDPGGAGYRLPGSRHLELVEATPFPSGVVVQIYRPQRR